MYVQTWYVPVSARYSRSHSEYILFTGNGKIYSNEGPTLGYGWRSEGNKTKGRGKDTWSRIERALLTSLLALYLLSGR